MATKNTTVQRDHKKVISGPKKAELLFNEIKGSLHGKGDVQSWILPNDKKEKSYSQQPAKAAQRN